MLRKCRRPNQTASPKPEVAATLVDGTENPKTGSVHTNHKPHETAWNAEAAEDAENDDLGSNGNGLFLAKVLRRISQKIRFDCPCQSQILDALNLGQ